MTNQTITKTAMKWSRALLTMLALVLGFNSISTAQTITTSLLNNNGSSVVVFSISNNSLTDSYIITDIGSLAGFTGTGTARLYAKAATYNVAPGAVGAVSSANGWTDIGSNTALATTANTSTTATGANATLWISGMTYQIPPQTQVRFCLQHVTSANAASFSATAGSIRYSTVGTQVCSFANGDLTLNACTNYGYGGTMASPTNSPRGFVGFVNYMAASPCTGTPAPGNTTGPATACVGSTINLGLQNVTSGTGVTYQWESADDAAFTVNVTALGTGNTQSTTYTGPKYYRCNVTCSGNTGTSNPLQVTSSPFLSCYCEAAQTSCSGDGITNVAIPTTALNNASTGCIGGNNYTYFTPGIAACQLMQGVTYTLAVTVQTDPNQWTNGWIDYNQSGTYDAGEELSAAAVNPGASGTTAISFTVPYTATPGLTRLRIRGGCDATFANTAFCGINPSTTWGEVEDYDIEIMANVGCTGQPTPGATLSTGTNFCFGSTPAFTYSLQNSTTGSGVTYSWERADDAAFTTNVSVLGTSQNLSYAPAVQGNFYVRCLVTCTNSGLSDYSTPILISQNAPNQCYCVPAYTSGIQFGDLISQVAIAGTTLNNNSGTATSPNISYTYYDPSIYPAPNYTGNLVAGNTYNCTVTIGSFSGQGVAAWIDLDQDGNFSAAEKIGSTPTTIGTAFGSATFPIVIPCNPTPGNYRLRVRCAWVVNGPTIDPCLSYGYGEAEDYMITIDPPLPCPAPSSFAASNFSSTGATFTWVNGCAETDWELEYGNTGFTPGTGTIESVSAPGSGYASTTMPCGSTLDVYLRANCLGNGYSTYVGPVSITTLPCPCTGAPPAANTLSSVSSACAATPFTLSLDYNYSGLTGITYQWESADDQLFTTNVVALGTGATETIANQTAPSYYRCNITCTTGPTTIQSTEVFVAQSAPNQCYCVPTSVGTWACGDGDVIAQVQILDGATVLYTNNSGTGCPSDPTPGTNASGDNGNGLSDYTGLGSVTNMIAGNTYTVKVFAGQYSEHYTAWIDYDDDGVFASTERIGYTTVQATGSGSVGVLGGSKNFTVVLACNPPSGVHRMRVKCAFGQTNGLAIDPCTTYSFMETEDYLVTIDPALPCPAPSSFASNTPTATGATFTWVNGCVETDWEIEFGATGFTPGSGTVEAATTNPFTATTMNCGTTYDVYLRANCLGNGYSTYVGPISVTTTDCPCTGAPAQANVVAPTTACASTSFTLSLDQAYTGISGITYQWESADDAAFTVNLVTLGNASTQVVSQTATSYYRCNVTCTASTLSTMANYAMVGMTAPTMCYCSAPAQTAADEEIFGVALTSTTGSMNNVSNCSTVAPGAGSLAGQYGNYMGAPSIDMVDGSTVNFTITLDACGVGTYNNGTAIFIDLNQDGDFDDAGEQVFAEPSTLPTTPGVGRTVTGSFVIPSGSTIGTTAMRVMNVEGSAGAGITPCMVYFYGETEDYTVTISPNNASLALTCYLQGYYIGSGMMNSVLNNQGLPNPTTDCDDVTVELHDATAPYATAHTFSGVLQTNGTITCSYPGSVVGNSYYIVVIQRNHVQTWSANPVTMAASTSYNFSTAANQAFGDNQWEVETGVFAFYAGDVNQDLAIDGFDYIDMDPNIVNGDCGYYATDVTGEGCVDVFDFLMVSPNIDAGVTIQAP